ncbi:MAG: hypothetical protein LUD40_16475 [Phocaeicola dorei]|nr:hypothetical protein [Phocaeicola dorei]
MVREIIKKLGDNVTTTQTTLITGKGQYYIAQLVREKYNSRMYDYVQEELPCAV